MIGVRSFRLFNPDGYEGVVLHGVGTSIGIHAKKAVTRGFGAYSKEVDAAEYRGRRVRLEATVRSEGVDGPRAWAGLAAGMFVLTAGASLAGAPLIYRNDGPRGLGAGLAVVGRVRSRLSAGP